MRAIAFERYAQLFLESSTSPELCFASDDGPSSFSWCIYSLDY
jgi:hypothetical protein